MQTLRKHSIYFVNIMNITFECCLNILKQIVSTSAVKRLITINHILNKKVYIVYVCVLCIFIMYI